ncbi:MAG TPA: hydroxyacid dehydrogenase, partial [Motilibacteraceae bacterium]|nr:hydroxyacid dehydrogenase [Motilibacteraceae bacterium]
HLPEKLFDAAALTRLRSVADVHERVLDSFEGAQADEALAAADVLLTGWGCPRVDAAVLARAPRVRALMHAAGSVKGHVDPVCWERGILVSSAVAANALPVAEFALAAVLFAGKGVLALTEDYRTRRDWVHLQRDWPGIGNYRRVVGVVGASRIGRRLLELLRPFDLQVLLFDPYVDALEAAALGACGVELDELLAASDVVTLHAPAVPATRHMLDRRRLGLMRDGATLVNTARGSLVDGAALEDELVSGRLSAFLDVTDPDVPAATSPLWELPNVLLTPHVAGAAGNELRRLGDHAVDEVVRWVVGRPLTGEVRAEDLARIA